MRGRIDGVFDGILRGWAWNPTQPGQRLTVAILIDDEQVAPLTASLPRADLEQAGMGDGRHGLEFALPLRFQDGATHEIAIAAWWGDRLIRLDTATPRIPRRLHMLRGRVEGVAGGRLRGWAWDQARPETPVALELWHEDELRARLTADRYRPELAHGGIGGGAHGFELDLAGLAPPGAEVELRCAPEFAEWSLGRVVVPEAAPSRPPPARQFREEARQAEARRDQAAAARILEHGLRLHPGDFDLLVLRARVHLALQQWDTAEASARHALALRPDQPGPVVLLARLAGSLERHAEAADLWSRIRPQDSAWRERLTRRPQHLAALGRAAEALAEMALAARHRPEDPALAKALAEAARALGAEGAARSHLRRMAALASGDGSAALQLAALGKRTDGLGAEALASPLANPTLRGWPGPVMGVVESETQVAPGLVLRGAGIGFAAAAPREIRAGELPAYGLRLEVPAGGAETEFALEPAPGRPPLRMALEVKAEGEMPFTLRLRRPGEADQPLLEDRATRRSRLLRFDLPAGATGALALRLDGPGVLVVHPPRPLAPIETGRHAPRGFEAPELAGRLVPPPRRAPPAQALAETGLPFTTIEIASPPAALAETLRAVLDATAPFECVLTGAGPGIADPRIRLVTEDAEPAEGWVAQVEAPPAGGPGWLSALHRAAATAGSASAPGVRLEWRAPRSPSPETVPARPH